MMIQQQIKYSGRAILLLLNCSLFLFLSANNVAAQTSDALILTITPPLTKVNMVPGDVFKSSVKLVNNNTSAVVLYVDKLDFKSGEDGGIQFIQGQPAATGAPYLLTQWLELPSGPFTVEAQQSIEIPFVINLPADAEPGGHYAAILAGSKPMGEVGGSGLKISSLLASLIMLEVKGDINERGRIQEFSTDQKIYTQPQVDFTVRFSNTGNIHLQPQGEIKIYDMFGQEKGSVAINHATEYGNVLPDSIRKWNFNWTMPSGLSAMGRYKAMLILNYGNQASETANQYLYFWLIYPKTLLLFIGGLTGLILLIVFSLRFYIRRAILQTTSEAGFVTPKTLEENKISVIPSEGNGKLQPVVTVEKKIRKVN